MPGVTNQPSATSAIGTIRHGTCLGTKGADPWRSTNTAAAGECLTAQGDERTPCTAPDAGLRILKRVDDVSDAARSTACNAVPGAESTVEYSITPSNAVPTFGTAAIGKTYVVFCVAPAGS